MQWCHKSELQVIFTRRNSCLKILWARLRLPTLRGKITQVKVGTSLNGANKKALAKATTRRVQGALETRYRWDLRWAKLMSSVRALNRVRVAILPSRGITARSNSNTLGRTFRCKFSYRSLNTYLTLTQIIIFFRIRHTWWKITEVRQRS